MSFATQHGMHLREWILDSGATKHMTSNGVAFDTYEVIAPSNVYLNNDNIVQAIGMGSIVNEVLVKGKIKRICIKYVLHMPKFASKFALSKQGFVKHSESEIQPKRMHCETYQ